MQIRVTIEAVITLPEGTSVPEKGRALILPNGDWVKPWVVMEHNDDQDLTYDAAAALGIYVEETNIEWFEEETEPNQDHLFEEAAEHMRVWTSERGMTPEQAFRDREFLREMQRVMNDLGIEEKE